MLKSLVVTVLAFAFIIGCASKPKPADPGASAPAEGDTAPTIDRTALPFDPQGSDSGKIPGLNTVYFEYDKAALNNDTRRLLSQNAEWIKGNSAVTVQIEGHTDERGSVEYNLSLGERRAKSVKDYLAGQGVDNKRMTIISYGEEKPLATGDSESAWSKNRRANFVPLAQ